MRDLRVAFDERRLGALVAVSRSIIHAEPRGSEAWTEAIARAAGEHRRELEAALG